MGRAVTSVRSGKEVARNPRVGTSRPVGVSEVHRMKSIVVLALLLFGGYWVFKKYGS